MEIAKRSVRGSLILFVGNFSSAVIGAVTIILIARLLGPDQYGVYSLALVIPGLLQLFVGFGVTGSVIRYSAYSISVGKPEEARRLTRNAISFLWLTGAAFTILSYALAGSLSGALLNRPDLTPYVQLTSLSIMGNVILQTITMSAMGWSWMSLSSLSTVAQGMIKLALSPLLIVVGLGVTGALAGHVVSLAAAGILGTVVLYLARLRGPAEAGAFASDIRKMLGFGLPLYAGGLVSGLATYYATIVIAGIATNAVYGFYQAALNFLTPITLVSTALVGALFPAFASIDGIGGDARQAFRHAYKFVAFLLTPIIVFMVSAAALLTRVLYGASYVGSAHFLQLLALAYIPIAFGYSVHPAFFNGFGRPKFTLFISASGALALVVCVTLFSVRLGLGVDGVIYATLLSFFVAWAVGTFLAWRFMGATLDLRANGAILLISAVSYAATSLLPTFAHSSVLSLLVDFFVFFGLYLTLAPVAGAVNGGDLDIMEQTFRDLRSVSSVFGLLLRYERLILSLRGRIAH